MKLRENLFYLVIAAFYLCFVLFKDSFVYKSYFFFACFILFVCVFLIYFSFVFRVDSGKIKINLPIILAFLLITIPFIIYLITNKIGLEFVFYYVCVFVLFIIFSFMQNSINILKINKLIIAFAFCETVICFLQFCGIIKSSTDVFEVTGISFNPNITAMFIALSLPVIISFFNKSNKKSTKIFLCLLIGFELIALILLKSRTAFLGVCVIVFLLLLKNYYKNRKIIAIISVCVVLISILAIPKLYNLKKDSADGRFFIWKVATEMINKNPSGYGYGTTQSDYNKAQSVYFQQHTTTKQEQNTAEFTFNLMNDYLETAVMGGIAGGILYLAFIISILYFGLKHWNTNFYAFIGVFVFAVMSLVNFAFFVPQIALLFTYYSAISTKNAKALFTININKNLFFIFGSVFLFIACGFIFTRYNINSAYNLLDNKNPAEAKVKLKRLNLFTPTNEIYYRCFGDCYFAEKDFENALKYYSKAINYSYYPKTLIKMANCEFYLKNFGEALDNLQFTSNIQPVLFEPHYCEMMIYLNIKDLEKAHQKANFILQKEIKFENKKIDFYREQANKILKIKELQ